jgi:RNA polymerase sigma-70 factor (ECF subfamily)
MAIISSPVDDGSAIGATLIGRAAAGDEIAFTRIVAIHHGDMTRVAYLVCGDLDLADDAVAAAWAIVWRRLGDLREADRLRPWLVTIAANEARGLIRRRSRRSIVELHVADPGNAGHGADPAERTADLDLANAMSRLDPEDRALLALRYVAGFDSFELARATGRSASGTRARLARLLDRLRTELSDD